MKLTISELLKEYMSRPDVKQVVLAKQSKISRTKLIDIRDGRSEPTPWELRKLLEIMGHPSDNLIDYFLENIDVRNYIFLQKIEKALINEDYGEVKDLLDKIDPKSTKRSKYLRQFTERLRILISDFTPEISIENYKEVLKITIEDFDFEELSLYRLDDNEFNIIMNITIQYSKMDKHAKAIKIMDIMSRNIDRYYIDEDKKGHRLTWLFSIYATSLGRDGRYEDSFKMSKRAYQYATEYKNFKQIPIILYTMASACNKLGKREVTRQLLQRSYSYAIDSSRFSLAENIKKDAKENFSIILEDTIPILWF